MAWTWNPRPPWPKNEEPGIKARPNQAYAARKAALTDPRVRLSLDLVEEAIAVDPFHRHRRYEVGEVIYDVTEPGLMVSYTIIDEEVVYLSFADLTDR